jgi:hypothetical protein
MLSKTLLKYCGLGWPQHPVFANKKAAFEGWPKRASADPAFLEACRRQLGPFIEFALVVPTNRVAIDADEKAGKHGIADFARVTGCDLRNIQTPVMVTPSGGLIGLFATEVVFGNWVEVGGLAIDTRGGGNGYVVLPDDDPHNGREWVPGHEPWTLTAALVPPWFKHHALSRERAARRLPSQARPPSSDPQVQWHARVLLGRACRLIVGAANGTQDTVRHAQCFLVGLLVGRGELGYDEAFVALCAAANMMPAYGKPWRRLSEKVERSLHSGIDRAGVTR